MPRSRVSAWILALVAALSLTAVTTRLAASDEIEFYAWLRSAAFDRDVDFRNEYQTFYDAAPDRLAGFKLTFLDLTNEAGHVPNFAPVGTAILWSPFYAVGHLAAVLTGEPRDGYSHPYIVAVTWASAIYGFAALLLTWSVVRQIVGRGAVATMTVAVGTPLIFYMYVAPGFSHACSAFAVSLFLWTWLRVRTSWSVRGLIALGLTGALLPMVREQDVFFLAGPAIDFVRSMAFAHRADDARAKDSGRLADRLRAAAAGVLVFALAYLPQLLAYQALNGHPTPTRLVMRKMTWTSPHLLGVLISPQHGFFIWTPLAALACAGLVLLAAGRVEAVHRDARWIALLAVVMIALQAYVSGCVESWTVAGSFGQRRFVAVTPLIALGLAAITPSISASRPRRWLAGAALVLGIWWNLGLMAQFGLHLMDRQRLTPASNARITFIELPGMAPAIAWRYLTDRESFYGLPPQ
jgi:hypothetical protein